MTYTIASLLSVLGALLLDLVLLRTRLVTRRGFWVAYAIVVGFQLLTNGILTGRGVVAYDGAAVLGTGSAIGQTPPFLGQGRVAFAPVEDLLFGFSLVLQTLSWWVFWGRRSRGAAAALLSAAGEGAAPRRDG